MNITFFPPAKNFLLRLLLVAVFFLPTTVILKKTIHVHASDLDKINDLKAIAASFSASEQVHLPVIINAGNEIGSYLERPYSSSSIWNTPIGPSPKYDPHSFEMVATIGLDDEGMIFSDPSQYSFPVFVVDASTPRWSVPCIEYKCLIVTPNGNTSTSVLKNAPIPSNALPSDGHDAQMIVIDPATNTEYDFWHVDRTESGWKVDNASVYNITMDGMPDHYNSRGAGVPYLAGLIRPWEIMDGRIQHALAFGYPQPAAKGCVFPASKTDGDSNLSYAIPEGARLQLDPSLTEDDFAQMGLNKAGKLIARALQEYGMILVDNSGHAKIYAEDLENNPYAAQQWSDPGLGLANNTIANIPYEYFRVLALPTAYWNSGVNGPMHGECHR